MWHRGLGSKDLKLKSANQAYKWFTAVHLSEPKLVEIIGHPILKSTALHDALQLSPPPHVSTGSTGKPMAFLTRGN